jgi:hypothetical protein
LHHDPVAGQEDVVLVGQGEAVVLRLARRDRREVKSPSVPVVAATMSATGAPWILIGAVSIGVS